MKLGEAFPFIDQQFINRCAHDARNLAAELRLRFTTPRRGTLHGDLLGSGAGASLEYYDHRPYTPGDDPRSIDWNAYARLNQYSLKLFHEEVAPHVDLILDCSPSCFYDRSKAQTTLQLLFYVAACVAAEQGRIRYFIVSDDRPAQVETHQISALAVGELSIGANSIEMLRAVPAMIGATRVLISDLLFPGDPDLLLARLGDSRCRSWIFAPASPEEYDPQWSGSMEFVDCEHGDRRVTLRIDQESANRMREGYRQHFLLWSKACLRRGITLVTARTDRELAQTIASAESIYAAGGRT